MIGARAVAASSRLLKYAVGAAVVWALTVGVPARAQDTGTKSEVLTKEEFARFLEEYRRFQADFAKTKDENELLRSEMGALRNELSTLKQGASQAELERSLAEMRASVMADVSRELDRKTERLLPGLTNFTLGGFASARFDNRRGSDSTFGASLAPILLWKPMEELLFETRFDIFLAEEGTATELAYAQISYLLNDYLTIGGGKFVLPFGIYWERAAAPWINKLPTMPLLYERGLVGEAGLGVQVRGGAPIGPTKINYAAYIMNGPDFRTNASDAGRLGFGRHRDNNNNKAAGGRIGFLPIPELEIGSSILAGRVGSSGSRPGKVDTLILGVDLTYGREFDAIKGRLDVRGEMVWVDTDDINFGDLFNPFRFENRQNGWYLQAAYRPTKVDFKLFEKVELKNLEFVVRYDQLQRPGPGALGIDRDQLTLGLDYWILPNAVLKVAYTFDDARGGRDLDAFFIEMSVGF